MTVLLTILLQILGAEDKGNSPGTSSRLSAMIDCDVVAELRFL